MYLTSRPATLEDLDTVFPYVQARLAMPHKDKARYVKFWSALLSEADCIAPVILDRDLSKTPQVAFGLTFLIPQEIADTLMEDAPPYPWRWMLARWERNGAFWEPKKAARLSHARHGANIFALCYGFDALRYDKAQTNKIRETLSVAFQKHLMRQRARTFLEEVYGEEERDRFVTFGLEVLRDYSQHFKENGNAPILTMERPYFMGADFFRTAKEREHMETVVGKQAMMGPPRFFFKAADQEVLSLAEDGATDEAIAEKLHLSVAAIKKRWQAIYARVEAVDPQLFLKDEPAKNAGPQRRSLLLGIMREHPEEYWPN